MTSWNTAYTTFNFHFQRQYVFHLKDLYNLELSVHNQYVLFLRFNLRLHRVSIRAAVWINRKEPASSQDYLGHQFSYTMNGPHHITTWKHIHTQKQKWTWWPLDSCPYLAARGFHTSASISFVHLGKRDIYVRMDTIQNCQQDFC